MKTRWIIFGGMFLVIVFSYVLSIPLESKPSPAVQKAFDFIENLTDSSVVIFSFDHEASSLPEIKPIALVMLRHAFKNKARVIGLSLFAEGTVIGYRMMTKAAEEYNLEYGRDYIFLGFKPQHISAILGIGESIVRVFPEDYLGNKTDTVPIMRNIKNYENIEMVITIADGDRPAQWIEYGGARYDQQIMAGLTAAMITSYDPYLASGQLYSVVGGLKGAAEYENLFGQSGSGSRGMLAQTSAHFYVIALIIIGNIIYFRNRKQKGRG